MKENFHFSYKSLNNRQRPSMMIIFELFLYFLCPIEACISLPFRLKEMHRLCEIVWIWIVEPIFKNNDDIDEKFGLLFIDFIFTFGIVEY